MTPEDALKKARKLSRLAGSENIHEAGNAARMLAALVERYAIDRALLEDAPPQDYQPKIVRATIYTPPGSRLPAWIGQLAWGIGRASRVEVWTWSRNGRKCLQAAGTGEGVETVRTLLTWIMEEVERLQSANQPSGLARGAGRKWAHSFRLGCVQTISDRLREGAEEARKRLTLTRQERYALACEAQDLDELRELDAQPEAGGGFALAKVKTALVRLDKERDAATAWVKSELNLRRARGPRVSSSNAFAAGRKAGHRASLTAAKGRIS